MIGANPFPSTEAERDALRMKLLDQEITASMRRATKHSLSLNCREDNHRHYSIDLGWVGCKNDGYTCLCRCHDFQERKPL